MKYKVIFDTNIIRSEGLSDDFFGGRQYLTKFSKISEIIIPDAVIEEIKIQKKEHIQGQKEKFLENSFIEFMKLNKKSIENFDIDGYILKLYESEHILHKTISLTNKSSVEEINKLFMKTSPKFRGKFDIRFKDAYIYLTILEFLKNSVNEKVFFVTEDKNLKKLFAGNTNIKVIEKENYNEFESEYMFEYFKEDYFILQLRDSLDNEDINAINIKKVWKNLEDNWILRIEINRMVFSVDFDPNSNEIIGWVPDFSDLISILIKSSSSYYVQMHMSFLRDYKRFFSPEEIHNLIVESIENSQITIIATDENVNEFFLDLYARNKKPLDEKSEKEFKNIFEISS